MKKEVIKKYLKQRKKKHPELRKVNVQAPNELVAYIINLADATHRISVISRNNKTYLQEIKIYTSFKMIAECLYLQELK